MKNLTNYNLINTTDLWRTFYSFKSLYPLESGNIIMRSHFVVCPTTANKLKGFIEKTRLMMIIKK
jgi:hypothetical protein